MTLTLTIQNPRTNGSDQRLFLLNEEAYVEFVNILDEPPPASDKLKQLLATKAPWEK